MDHYRLFGYPLGHSLSPRIYQLFSEQTQQPLIYDTNEVTADAFPEAIRRFFNDGGQGANVTAPLKGIAAQWADRLTPAAQLGSVNMLIRLPDGQILGDNSDGFGLINDLQRQQLLTSGARLLLLGAGGAARGLLPQLLATQPAEIVLLNRTESTAVALAEACCSLGSIRVASLQQLPSGPFDLVIQATSVRHQIAFQSMMSTLPWPMAACYDLNYSSTASLTPFLQWAGQQGATQLVDGLGMLVEQAAYAFNCWRQVTPSVDTVLSILRQELACRH
ncbi:MAG: shikimate dehydrogenase [Candidatus Symbiodolus clandestinus]